MLGESKDKGVVIIPEGREGGGWRGFSQEVDGVLTPADFALHHQRRQTPSPAASGVHKNSNTGGESRTFKEAVIHGNEIPKFLHASNGGRVDSHDSSKAVTDSVEIFLKVIVGHGLDNKWEVKWAGVVDKPSPIEIQQGPQLESATIPQIPYPVMPGPNLNNKPNFPINTNKPPIVTKPNNSAQAYKATVIDKSKGPKPAPKYVWRPREASKKLPEFAGEASGSQSLDRVSMCSEETESLHSESSMVPASQLPPIAQVLQGIGAVAKTWGSSSEWFIDLRNGRRVRLPMDLHNPVPVHEDETTQQLIQWVSAHHENFDVGRDDEVSTWGSQELEDGSEISWVEEDTTIIDIGEGVGTDNSLALVSNVAQSEAPVVNDDCEVEGNGEMVPLMVEPLAIAIPQTMVHENGEEVQAVGRAPSEKVLRKLKGVGKVLGSSFEGYEQRVLELLMDIEARHQQKHDEMISSRRPSSSGRKGCRELKGLVSSINFF